MKTRIGVVFLAIVVLVTSGCAFNATKYGVSVSNVESLRGQHIQPVAVASFTSYKPGLSTIACRAAGPVNTPDKVPFETYIHDAFVDELKLAGIYDPNASVTLQGRLELVDFNSNIGAGKWMLSLTLSSAKSSGYTTQSEYPFSTNWVADKACQQVAQAFAPAVQKLLGEVVGSAKFKTLAQ